MKVLLTNKCEQVVLDNQKPLIHLPYMPDLTVFPLKETKLLDIPINVLCNFEGTFTVMHSIFISMNV